MNTPHSAEHLRSADLERLFSQCFFASHRTILTGGASEPFYDPATASEPAKIIYSHDYFRSALHEIAHWCVAGPARRQLPDYGYWYAPDGRDEQQQAEFERLEVRPQAFELLFCAACGHEFRVSMDNLGGAHRDLRPFERAVKEAAAELMQSGLPQRASLWASALAHSYRGEGALNARWLDEIFRSWGNHQDRA